MGLKSKIHKRVRFASVKTWLVYIRNVCLFFVKEKKLQNWSPFLNQCSTRFSVHSIWWSFSWHIENQINDHQIESTLIKNEILEKLNCWNYSKEEILFLDHFLLCWRNLLAFQLNWADSLLDGKTSSKNT